MWKQFFVGLPAYESSGMKTPSPRSVCVWVVLFMMVVGPVIFRLEAKDLENLTQTIEQERTDLEQIQKEIEHTKKKKERTLEEQDQTLRKIEELDKQLAQERKDFEVINSKIKKTDRELSDISQGLETLRTRLQTGRKSILARLRLLYMEGRGGPVKTLLATKSYEDFQRRFEYLSAITKREYILLKEYRTNLDEVESLLDRQAKAREALLNQRKNTEKLLQKVKKLRSNKHAILASLQKETLSHEKTLEALERRENRKEALLKELEQRRRLEEARVPSKGLSARAGSFLWPADGEVITRFGKQKHPTFDTFIHKKGIEIRTSEGSTIRAVSSGNVVYADWLKGYGLVVIVDHRNGFFSLYAHASKLLVKEGDPVKPGETIGETGDSGLTDKNVLYFELRKGTDPVDPLVWLVKRP